MKAVVFDPEALYPLEHLVTGPFESVEELAALERVVRTLVLHDAAKLLFQPLPYNGTERIKLPNGGVLYREEVSVMPLEVALGLDPRGELFTFSDDTEPHIDLAPALVELAKSFANRGAKGSDYLTGAREAEHIRFLHLAFGIVNEGGSAVLNSEFGREAIRMARTYPEFLFKQLDEEWQRMALEIENDGMGVLIPPVLGIVLSRCARRDAIPYVIRDLREEWAEARKKVWGLVDALRVCGMLSEAQEIRRELAEASRLFAPESSELDSRPVRVLWEIVAAGAAGAGVTVLSGGKPAIGAVAGALTQAARNMPGFTHEFGAMLFGRGAFDLARRVRREVSRIELNALPRLLTKAERKKLGFR